MQIQDRWELQPIYYWPQSESRAAHEVPRHCGRRDSTSQGLLVSSALPPAARLGCCLCVPCGLAGLRSLEGRNDHLAPALFKANRVLTACQAL